MQPDETAAAVGIVKHNQEQSKTTQTWGYALSDAQNARLLVDGAGALARRWRWEPFETARAESGTTPARFGYSGEERDDETGLVNLREDGVTPQRTVEPHWRTVGTTVAQVERTVRTVGALRRRRGAGPVTATS